MVLFHVRDFERLSRGSDLPDLSHTPMESEMSHRVIADLHHVGSGINLPPDVSSICVDFVWLATALQRSLGRGGCVSRCEQAPRRTLPTIAEPPAEVVARIGEATQVEKPWFGVTDNSELSVPAYRH